MSQSTTPPINEYVEFWNDTLAEKFTRFQEILMNGLSYHSRVPLERPTVTPGARILDVGCGWGDTAIVLARKTGPRGEVLGLDFLPPPGEDARTCGPGPFSMANPEVVTQQLEIAGFTDIAFERNDGPVEVGDSVENAMRFQLALGPAGEVFREAGEEAERQRPQIEEALRQALAPYERDGKIVMGSSSWTITARKPAA